MGNAAQDAVIIVQKKPLLGKFRIISMGWLWRGNLFIYQLKAAGKVYWRGCSLLYLVLADGDVSAKGEVSNWLFENYWMVWKLL